MVQFTQNWGNDAIRDIPPISFITFSFGTSVRDPTVLKSTEDSCPSGSFFTQVDHLFLANSFSKQVIKPQIFSH